MKKIVVFAPEDFTPKNRERLSKAGYVAVAAVHPVRLLSPELVVASNELLLGALESMGEDGSQASLCAKAKFVNHLKTILKKSIKPE